MSLERPIREWETLDASDQLVGRSWIVESEHAGHRMTVLGRISADTGASSMVLVGCSCGHEFRMAGASVGKKVN